MSQNAGRRTAALRLRAQGLTLREIAERVGAHPRTVARWCSPETARKDQERERGRNGAKRRREREHRAACPSCGEPMCSGSASPSKEPDLCRSCRDEEERERLTARAKQIEKWWAAGMSSREIADRLGWSMDHMSVEMVRMRERGFHLPYRYTTGKRAGRKFAEAA